ncbi:sigma factor-like helix-turn-helix DNA-binding protein [Streptomyces sp. NPDC002133]|uniref:sigma factor-like helix-turn-helix DNA-binding protein n=1 Tax=Streptomyces sp. NPDC002133 TaxID=3154409 RepID=UPI00332FA919
MTHLVTGDEGGSPDTRRQGNHSQTEDDAHLEHHTFEQDPLEHHAFERDVLSLLDPMYRAALGVTGSPADAENLILDTFTQAYTSFPRLLPGTNHKTWLYHILTKTFIGPRRGQHDQPNDTTTKDGEDRTQTRDEPRLPAGIRLAELQAFSQLPAPDARAALQELPKQHRIAVYLAAVEGFTDKEIADIADAPIATAASWLHQGLLQLWTAEELRPAAPPADSNSDLVGAGQSRPA